MKGCLRVLLLAVLAFGFSNANASIIINGSFEFNDVQPDKWKWFDSEDVDGWQGSNIEIWDDLFGIESYDGDQHIELNAHAQQGGYYSIEQTFATKPGELYQLSFAYRARRNRNEAFNVALTTEQADLFTRDISDHSTRQWSEFSQEFEATGEWTTLSFTALNRGTLGNLLDAISVTELSPALRTSAPIPEPNAIFMFATGMLILLVSRFRKRWVKTD